MQNGDHNDTVAAIMAMRQGEVAGYIRAAVETRELHVTMTRLNKDMLSQDHARRQRARKVLDKLGFL